jgi:hypothetical protein
MYLNFKAKYAPNCRITLFYSRSFDIGIVLDVACNTAKYDLTDL